MQLCETYPFFVKHIDLLKKIISTQEWIIYIIRENPYPARGKIRII